MFSNTPNQNLSESQSQGQSPGQSPGQSQAQSQEQYKRNQIKFNLARESYLKGNDLLSINNAEAIIYYNKAISFNPDYIDAYYSKGLALNELGDKDGAMDAFDNVIMRNPQYIDAHYNKGSILGELRRSKEGLVCFNKVIEINPGYAMAYNNKGRLLYDLGKNKDAIKAYDKSILLNPGYIDVYRNKGVALRSMGKNEEAIKAYDKAIEFDHNDSIAYLGKGLAFMALTQYQNAIDVFDKAITANPYYADAYNNKGGALNHITRHEEALVCLNKAIELNPLYSDAYNNKGNVLNALGKYQEALEALNIAIELHPEESYSYCDKGVVLFALERYEDALEMYNKSIELDPATEDGHLGKANVLSVLGQYEDAIKSYDKVILIDPSNPAARCNQGIAFQMIGRHEDAVHSFDKAMELTPAHSSLYFNKAFSLYSLRQYDKIIKLMEVFYIKCPGEIEPSSLIMIECIAYGRTTMHDIAFEKLMKLRDMYRDESSQKIDYSVCIFGAQPKDNYHYALSFMLGDTETLVEKGLSETVKKLLDLCAEEFGPLIARAFGAQLYLKQPLQKTGASKSRADTESYDEPINQDIVDEVIEEAIDRKDVVTETSDIANLRIDLNPSVAAAESSQYTEQPAAQSSAQSVSQHKQPTSSKMLSSDFAAQESDTKPEIIANENIRDNTSAKVRDTSSNIPDYRATATTNISTNISEMLSNESWIELASISPVQIQEYFKRKKQEILNKKPVKDDNKSISSWIVDGKIYSSEDKENIIKLEGRDNYYIHIKEGLPNQELISRSIDKGVVTREFGCNGIKFFKNSNSIEFAEVKMHGDFRAWSQHIYKNEKGETLMMIDGYGNHNDVKRVANSYTNLQIIKTRSASLDKITQMNSNNNKIITVRCMTDIVYDNDLLNDPEKIKEILDNANPELLADMLNQHIANDSDELIFNPESEEIAFNQAISQLYIANDTDPDNNTESKPLDSEDADHGESDHEESDHAESEAQSLSLIGADEVED